MPTGRVFTQARLIFFIYYYYLLLKFITMNAEKTYIGTYKVYKVFRVSRKRSVIARGLTRDEAKRIVNSYPNSSRSMVVFDKQFYADKYYI